jgi:hypothetical protein
MMIIIATTGQLSAHRSRSTGLQSKLKTTFENISFMTNVLKVKMNKGGGPHPFPTLTPTLKL